MEVRLRHGMRALGVTLADDGRRADVDGRPLSLRQVALHRVHTADGADAAELLVEVGGRMRRTIVMRDGDRLLVSVDGHAHVFGLGDEARRAAAATGAGVTVAPMPGKIVRVLVAVGNVVAAGDPLVVLEAMKMETTLRAEIGGTVTAVATVPGRMVDAGAVLVEIAAATGVRCP
jgi:3-methylcrotonyl-CoA carboxylase alpha subunit